VGGNLDEGESARDGGTKKTKTRTLTTPQGLICKIPAEPLCLTKNSRPRKRLPFSWVTEGGEGGPTFSKEILKESFFSKVPRDARLIRR